MLALSTDISNPLAAGRTYRAYRLAADGRIEGVDFVHARDDDEAKTLAGKIANGHGIDLWDRARFLDRFPPLEKSA